MAQSALTIRLDSDLKMQFDSLCEEFGMSTNTAFNIYVRQVVRSRRIPFAIEAPAKDDIMNKGRAAFYEMRQAAADAGIQDMSLDEINEEIRLAGSQSNESIRRSTFLTASHNMHIFALPISVLVTTAGNGARFCATSAPKIGPRKCFILTLR